MDVVGRLAGLLMQCVVMVDIDLTESPVSSGWSRGRRSTEGVTVVTDPDYLPTNLLTNSLMVRLGKRRGTNTNSLPNRETERTNHTSVLVDWRPVTETPSQHVEKDIEDSQRDC